MSFGILSKVAATLSSTLHGSDGEYSGVNTDSRNLVREQLFVALRGPTHDGHDYVAAAETCGAAGALVEEIQDCNLTQIAVDNTTRALGDLARAWRQRFDIPVIGVTGSNGKTTVKQMLCAGPSWASRKGDRLGLAVAYGHRRRPRRLSWRFRGAQGL